MFKNIISEAMDGNNISYDSRERNVCGSSTEMTTSWKNNFNKKTRFDRWRISGRLQNSGMPPFSGDAFLTTDA